MILGKSSKVKVELGFGSGRWSPNSLKRKVGHLGSHYFVVSFAFQVSIVSFYRLDSRFYQASATNSKVKIEETKSLGEIGEPVGWVTRLGSRYYSRYVNRYYTPPSPFLDANSFIFVINKRSAYIHLPTGFLTACIAYLIITAEAVLFDLKEGYCVTNYRKAKRFCCPLVTPTTTSFFASPKARGGMSPNSFIQTWKVTAELDNDCENWRTWGEAWNHLVRNGDWATDIWQIDYIAFVFIAVSLLPLSQIL